MSKLNEEILSAIDNIDAVTMESQIEVLTAIGECYHKSILLMEYYDGNDLSSFGLFQESSDENKPKRKINIIDNIINWFRKAIRSISLGLLNSKIDRLIDKLKNLPDDTVFMIKSKSHKNSEGEIYAVLTQCIASIEAMTKTIENQSTNESDFDVWIQNHEKVMSLIKSMSDLENSNVSTTMSVSELISRLEIEQDGLKHVSPEIDKMLDKVDNVMKAGCCDYASNPDLVKKIRKCVDCIAQQYIGTVKVLLKRYNDFIQADKQSNSN